MHPVLQSVDGHYKRELRDPSLDVHLLSTAITAYQKENLFPLYLCPGNEAGDYKGLGMRLGTTRSGNEAGDYKSLGMRLGTTKVWE